MTATRIDQALEKLREVCRSAAGARLPPVRDLVVQWGFSSRTLREAVRRGVAQGWLQTRPGSGIWPAGHMPEAAPTPTRTRGADDLSSRLRAEIEGGVHPLGNPLPSVKDLARRHKLHPATARKALVLLEDSGLLERRGRAWVVSRPRTSGTSPVLLCIGAADATGRLRMDSDREWDFWREMQAEALRNGLVPELLPWDGGRIDLRDPAILGVVVCSWHMLDLRPLLDPIARSGIPCAVWVISHLPDADAGYRDLRTLWFHDMAFGREAGRSMAEFLSGLDLAKVAWISPFHESAWARNRLDGFLEGLQGRREVVPVLGRWVSEWDLHDSLLNDSEDWSGSLHPALRSVGSHPDLGDLVRPQIERLTRDRFLEAMTPDLEAALASGATLWVAASDLVATWVLHWLSERGINIPENLKLASFDDTRDASRLNLTSMRFDTAAMARAMLLQILSSRNSHRHLTHYHGRVIPRTSTSDAMPGRSRRP